MRSDVQPLRARWLRLRISENQRRVTLSMKRQSDWVVDQFGSESAGRMEVIDAAVEEISEVLDCVSCG